MKVVKQLMLPLLKMLQLLKKRFHLVMMKLKLLSQLSLQSTLRLQNQLSLSAMLLPQTNLMFTMFLMETTMFTLKIPKYLLITPQKHQLSLLIMLK